MRRIFTDFGTPEEQELFEKIKEVQQSIKRKRNGYPPIALKARSEQEFAITSKLQDIYLAYCSGSIKRAVAIIKELYNILLEEYKSNKGD